MDSILSRYGLSPSAENRAALREAAQRELARRHLIWFTRWTFGQYKADGAHELIASTLDRLVAGEISRLMVFAPPQHGKSELVSVRLPAFWLAHRPDEPVILTSYAASLAHNKSRQARAVVESPEFRELFGVRTDRASRAVDHWSLARPHRGGLLAAGVGGPITGHGAMLGIIDDPVENWEQAQSEAFRERTWEWYRTTFRTRIWEGGAIVLVMTRWHEDDLAGRLLAEQAEEWQVLRLPALAESAEDRAESERRLGVGDGADPLGREPGEALCPQRFSREALEQTRREIGALAWAGQYQGAPRAPEGNRFRRGWFTIVDAIPTRGLRWCRYWDRAATAGGGAYTAGVLMALSADNVVYVADVVRGQWSPAERDRVIVQTAQLDRARGAVQIAVEQEPGSSGVDAAQAAIRMLAGHAVYADRVTGSKDVRLEPFAAQAEAGNVRLLRGSWNGEWLDEMTAVPNSRYRDQADATAGAFTRLTAHHELVEDRIDLLDEWRG